MDSSKFGLRMKLTFAVDFAYSERGRAGCKQA